MRMEKLKKAMATATVTLYTALAKMTAYASDVFDTGWLTSEDNGKIAETTTKVKGYFASFYGLAGVVCIGIAVICCIMIGLKFMRGGKKSEDAKDDVLSFLIGCIFVFGGIGIVTTIVGIFKG